MSPEQLLAQPVDGRSDIYSAGTVLFQLLTGEKAFEGSLTSITYKILHSQVPKPSAIAIQAPQAVDAVVLCSMARNPNDRFATADDFLAALNRALTTPAREAAREGETVMMDRTGTAQSFAERRANWSQLPAHPSSLGPSVVETNGSRGGMRSMARVIASLGILVAGCVIGYDILLGVPIGTMPTVAGMTRLANSWNHK